MEIAWSLWNKPVLPEIHIKMLVLSWLYISFQISTEVCPFPLASGRVTNKRHIPGGCKKCSEENVIAQCCCCHDRLRIFTLCITWLAWKWDLQISSALLVMPVSEMLPLNVYNYRIFANVLQSYQLLPILAYPGLWQTYHNILAYTTELQVPWLDFAYNIVFCESNVCSWG